jgi:hypothetical protein
MEGKEANGRPDLSKVCKTFIKNQRFNSRFESHEFGSQLDITAHTKISQNCLTVPFKYST